MSPRISILIIFLTQLALFSLKAQKKPTAPAFRILTYGYLYPSTENASQIICKKWNIRLVYVAGCVVSTELKDSVKVENEKVFKFIEKKFGKNWEHNFFAEIDSEYKIETIVDSMVKKLEYLKNRDFVNIRPGAPFPMHPTDKKGNYIVIVNNYDREWNEEILYKLRVNYIDGRIKLLKDYTKMKVPSPTETRR